MLWAVGVLQWGWGGGENDVKDGMGSKSRNSVIDRNKPCDSGCFGKVCVTVPIGESTRGKEYVQYNMLWQYGSYGSCF